MSNKKYSLTLVAAVLAIVVTMTIVWLDAKRFHYIPCRSDCGSTIIALQGVKNFHLYGLKYGLMGDHATGPDLNAHPVLYTHNMHIGTLVFVLADAAGLTSVASKQFVTLFAFGAGLFYVFLTISAFTGSRLCALIVLLLFCSEFEYVFNFSLSALRAWNWLALFGGAFHTLRLSQCKERRGWAELMAVAFFALIAFLLGYNYWIICLLTNLLIVIIGSDRALLSAHGLRLACGVMVVFAIPFLLRQIHIIAVMGPDFWWHDLLWTSVIKINFLRKFVTFPSSEMIDAFYRSAFVVRFAQSPPGSIFDVLRVLGLSLNLVVVPTLGWINFAFLLMSFVLGLSVLMLSMFRRAWIRLTGCATAIFGLLAVVFGSMFAARSGWVSHEWVMVGCSAGALGCLTLIAAYRMRKAFVALPWVNMFRVVLHRRCFNFKGSLILVGALSGGTVFGLAILAPHSFNVFLEHKFPLIIASALILKGLFLYLFLECYRYFRKIGGFRPRAFLVLSCFVILMHFYLQWQNISTSSAREIDVSWIPAVKERAQSTFAVSWIAESVSPFTDNWVVSVMPGREPPILDRFKMRQPLFVGGECAGCDYFYFFQRDREKRLTEYLRPDYWLYFPIDQMFVFLRQSGGYQMRVEEMVRRYPGLPIVAKGRNWVLFDLRSYHDEVQQPEK